MTSTFTKISIVTVFISVSFGVFGFFTNSNIFISDANAQTTCGDCGTGGGDVTGGGSGGGGGTTTVVPTCNLSANLTMVNPGGQYVLSWVGGPAAATFKLGGTNVSDTGSYTLVWDANDVYITYTLTGELNGKTCSDSVTVYRQVEKPVCDLTTNLSVVKVGDQFTIHWSGTPTHSTVYKINNAVVNPTGSATYTFPTNRTSATFTLTAANAAGTCSKSVTITKEVVNVPAPTCVLTPHPASIVTGSSSKLTWTVTNAVSGAIDQGIGAVNPNNTAGFRNVSPTATKTYTMTVVNSANVSAICTATVNVTTVPTPDAPTCVLTPHPASIVTGSSSRLTWTYTNAVSGAIDQGVGVINLTNVAGRSVSPTGRTVYTMTVKNSANVTATCTATVNVTTPNAPLCQSFHAEPITINRGQSTNLSWSSLRATSAAINNGVGSVAVNNSSYPVSPTESTVYILTLAGVGGTTNCEAPVTVVQPHSNNLSCAQNVNSFYADDSSITEGDSTTLHWDTTGVTSASLTDYGSVSLDGSQSVSPSSDRTYNLTVSKGSDSVSCPVTINVGSNSSHHGGGSVSPRCTLKISDKSISLGERTTLTWDTSNAFEMTLKDNHGKTLVSTEDRSSSDKKDLFDGEMTLRPEQDTTYTLQVDRGSKDDDCEVSVDVSDVVVSQIRDQQPLVSGIALTQVPYTGFEAGPIMTFIFYGLLALWALYLAYVLVVRRNALSFATVAATPVATAETIAHFDAADVHGVFTPAAVATPVFHQSVTAPVVAAATTATVGYAATVTDAVSAEIENQAHAAKVLLSADAVQAFVATTPAETRMTHLDTVLATAKGTYPTEDGWVILGEERMKALLTA